MADLEKLFSDDKFVERISNVKTDEEFKQVFKENGIELTDEQVNAIKVNLKAIAEDELGEVSGGSDDVTLNASVTVNADNAALVGGSTILGSAIGAYLGWVKGAINAKNSFQGGDTSDALKHVVKSACKGALKGGFVGAGAGAVTGAAVIGMSHTVKDANVTAKPGRHRN